uniref:Phage portal protein n=1 Tax=candidate division CPR3 bacterium TaxID=2268181 RepID=A0A7V3JAE2_UNCC3
MARPTNEDAVSKVETLWKQLEDARFRYTRQWYINWAFYENNHFVWWRKSTQTIDRVNPPKGSVLRAVPKARRQVEGVQNLILSSEPRWVVIPDEETKDADEVARRVNHFLQEGWQHWNVRDQLDELVLYALIYPYSVLEVGFDSLKDDIYVDVYDSFDIALPLNIKDIEEAPYVIKTKIMTKAELEANPDFENVSKVIYDNRLAASDMKEARLSDKFAAFKPQYEEFQTVIVKEAWIKERTKDGIRMRVITVAGGQKLREKVYNIHQYPFVVYKPFSGSFYQPAFIEKLIPLNKSLDVFVSQIENFTNVMVRGRYLKHKLSNISRLVNEDGEIVEYDSVPPQPMEIPSLPNFLFVHTNNIEKWIEEAGTTTAALGKVPKGVRAYKAIESLKQSDFANLRVPVMKLQDVVQRLTEKVIDLAATNYLLPKTIYRMGDEDQPDYFKVIGEEGLNHPLGRELAERDNAIVIKKSFRVKASIENALSYTEEGKRDTLRELYSAGIIGKRTLLEGFKFGNVSEILEEAKEETNISMIETPDFQLLPDELKQHILEYLTQPDTMLQNPIARAEVMNKQRKQSRKSIKRS